WPRSSPQHACLGPDGFPLLGRRSFLLSKCSRWGIAELTGYRGEFAAFTVPPILEVNPIVSIDVFGRNPISLLEKGRQQQPSSHLLGSGRLGNVRKVADKLHADRIRFDNRAVGIGIVDVLVVVAIAAIAMGRNYILS